MYRISVIGAGSWGTALSIVLAQKGYNVKLWTRNSLVYEQIINERENKRYLPGVKLLDNIQITMDIEYAVHNTQIIIIGVPSQAVRENTRLLSKIAKKEQIIVSVAKGLEIGTMLRMSEVIEQELPGFEIAILSGPSHAEEVSRNIPTACVVSSKKRKIAEFVQDIFMTSRFRIYTNPDVVGVELGGALKNIIAIGCGISDGLGFGDNSRAALMTRGITEISRLGKSLGAQVLTFAGLSGLGDMIVTCTSMYSRNRKAGILIGQGIKVEDAVKSIGMVVEGFTTTKAAYELSMIKNVSMPITAEIYKVLYEGKSPEEGVGALMMRGKTHEIEEVALEKGWI